MKKIIKSLGLVSLLFLGVSCGSDDDATTDNGEMVSSRFESQLTGDMEMETILDTETNLVWINDITGCFAGIINPTTQCEELTFAGRSDWRIPSAAEMAELITAIDERGITLNYINSACALMATSDEGLWVFTENSDAPGQMTMMEPGNAGLRCVTDN